MRVRVPRLLPHQLAFVQDHARLAYAQGGVGSGKTMGGACRALDRHITMRGDGMIVAPSWPLLHRITLRTYLSLLPRSILRRHSIKERYIELRNGHRCYYGSTDKPETLEGSNLAWAWLDEARHMRRSAYDIMLARMRVGTNPELFVTSTPSRGWLYDEFGEPHEGRTVVRFRTADNPYNPPDYLDVLRRSLSPRLYQQYVEGEFVLAHGAVFREYDQRRHVQPGLYDPTASVCVTHDPGYRRSASLFFQHLPYCQRHGAIHCIHVLAEVIGEETATVWLLQRWQDLIVRNHWSIEQVYVDPAANSRQIALGTSDVDVIESAGYRVVWTTDPYLRSITTGIESIRSKLQPVTGPPSLYFDASLLPAKTSLDDDHQYGILRAMSDSEYPQHKDGHPVSDQPIKDGKIDHARDALRYAVINTCPIPGASRIEVY